MKQTVKTISSPWKYMNSQKLLKVKGKLITLKRKKAIVDFYFECYDDSMVKDELKVKIFMEYM